ncbi:MAG TPA: hypothetical protein VF378_03155 [Geothrix sp.]
MSDPRQEEKSPNNALRIQLEAWLNLQNQALLEEVMATWQGALAKFHPDEALLSGLRGTVSPSAPSGHSDPPDTHLAMALDLLEAATSQSDLLKRLLDALAPLVERSALFVLKQGLASLYTHRGFETGAPLRSGAVVPPPDLEAVIQGLSRSLRSTGPGYSALLSPISRFEAADVAIFPIRHKKKTVALLLVDSGLRQKIDHPVQVRALTLATSAMLASLAAGKEEEPRPQPVEPPASAPTQVVPDAIETAPRTDLDPRTRAAAERLARVLVGDVELYFPDKVAKAHRQGNLYGLLRDELERSRATFVDRFGEGVEIQYRIFTSTIIQLLCDGDGSKLGAAPWA